MGLRVHTCGVQSDPVGQDQGKRFELILEVSLKPLGLGILGCRVPETYLEGGAQKPGGHIGPLTPAPGGGHSLRRARVCSFMHRAQARALWLSPRAQRKCTQRLRQLDFPSEDDFLASQTKPCSLPAVCHRSGLRAVTQEGHMNRALSGSRNHRL